MTPLPRIPIRNAHPAAGLVLAVCALLSGCKAKELGANISATQASVVDHTWVTAARSCWPSLAHGTEKYVSDSLRDPIAFRGAFTAYATFSDAELESIAAHDIFLAPPPDTGFLRDANSPVLTREEAAATKPSKAANAPDSRDAKQISADALCAIHAGTPVGFR